MSLKNIPLKKAYDSDYDDILNDFYIPALSNSLHYKRLAGFFSSSSLSIAARGISTLIDNGGYMQLIVSPKFDPNDWVMIKEIYENPSKFIEKQFISELESLEDGIKKDHVRALGWMLMNGKLKIRVAFVRPPTESNDEELESTLNSLNSLFHLKVGILEDKEGICISFSGSDNETASAWLRNIEEFKVFRSWVPEEADYFKSDKEKFERFWNNVADKTIVIDLPKVVEKKLIDLAPKDISELNLSDWTQIISERPKRVIKLRNYQLEACTNWFGNNKTGIFEMATGTGKTVTALECLKRLQKEKEYLLVIISCPTNHLIQQWYGETESFRFPDSRIIIADSSNNKWEKELNNEILDLISEVRNLVIVITSHSTLSSEKFKKVVKKYPGPKMLIADEMHWLGAPELSNGLDETYNFRLGLSATPERWWDEEGTQELTKYFDKVVFNFPLKRAITEIDPDTHESYLTPYRYKPYFVELSDDEFQDYVTKTKKLARLYHQAKSSKEKELIYTLLCKKRQDIVRNATTKYDVLIKILSELPNIDFCLIYCSPQQVDTVRGILDTMKLKFSKFTGMEGIMPQKEYGGLSERQVVLREFAKGKLQVLIGIKCLDEGVDVKPTRTAIILASTGNPREYIQRRGRILRRFPGKSFATIYDMIVVPQQIDDPNLFEIEKRIMEKEFLRYKEFAESSMNLNECIMNIRAIEDRYGLFLG